LTCENKPYWFLQKLKRAENEPHWFSHVKRTCLSFCLPHISSSYKVIVSLQKIWSKPLNSYGLVLRSLYELYEKLSKW